MRLPCEDTLARERSAGNPLLLHDITIRLMTSGGADPGVLRSILESSGARVSNDDDSPSIHPDLTIVDSGSGPLTLQVPGSDSLSPSLARTASPSHIVRTVARTMVTTRTP